MLEDRTKINERIEKNVAEKLQALKKEWRAKNISQVIDRLYLEYKYNGKNSKPLT
jgi:hypothetical protein